MTQFTIHRDTAAQIQAVWAVLDDFGNIHRWNPGVRASRLTSDGPVGRGSTRRCDLAPFGAVNERIATYEAETRMTVEIHEVFRLPITEAVADFELAQSPEGGTRLTIVYRYTPSRLGRAAAGTVHRQLEKGIGGLADGLIAEAELIAG